jgi:hypothetical protein
MERSHADIRVGRLYPFKKNLSYSRMKDAMASGTCAHWSWGSMIMLLSCCVMKEGQEGCVVIL